MSAQVATQTPLFDRLRSQIPRRALTNREAVQIADRLALRLRQRLEQVGPSLDMTSLPELPWIAGVETRRDMPMSGITIFMPKTRRWVVTVNANEPEVRQRFSMAHELCHTIIDELGEVILPTTRWADHADRIERFCDQFAGSLLMPKPLLRADWVDGIQVVSRLARRYGVSRMAMAVRLRQLGLIDETARCEFASERKALA